MRSRAIKLDVQFAEAKACGRMDRPFAVTCLALLRQTCATHAQKELLLSIADSLEELIFSRVPSFEGARPRTPGASSGGEYEGLAWFELYKRAEEVAVLVLVYRGPVVATVVLAPVELVAAQVPTTRRARLSGEARGGAGQGGSAARAAATARRSGGGEA